MDDVCNIKCMLWYQSRLLFQNAHQKSFRALANDREGYETSTPRKNTFYFVTMLSYILLYGEKKKSVIILDYKTQEPRMLRVKTPDRCVSKSR